MYIKVKLCNHNTAQSVMQITLHLLSHCQHFNSPNCSQYIPYRNVLRRRQRGRVV